ncbi:phosphoserine phosphatase RsbU/P [Frankia sp. AiPs1]|uniref:SpoIIE family protein phosphatase n=1 Tax=Frankia sp. AiPa1 TaxID=573492 RepID=UPI00202B3C46|nr:SpoIIE family protein phosphatase [Frankia sp. AiPa1]MCL9760927.1 SpoIIE family protein phosphatase [Frankia sp. AiPa1]
MSKRFGLAERAASRTSPEVGAAALAAAVDVGIWEHNVPSGRLRWDRRTAELHGLDPDCLRGTIDTLLTHVHPDDIPAVRTGAEEARQGVGSFLLEYRVVHSDGSYTWIHDRGRVMSWSRRGRPLRAIGTSGDATPWRSTVEILQRAILPLATPKLPGIELVARYLPADRDTEIGGDWYDATALPDGNILLMIGDVGGHGLPAVAAMAELRHAARAYAYEGHSPAAITTQLSANLAPGVDGPLATAVVALFASDTGRLTWSCAGHPPPLLLTGKDAAYLDDTHGPTLGAEPAFVYDQSDLRLLPGTRLLLYTDGLVERRDVPITDRLDTLATTVSNTAEDPHQNPQSLANLCDSILATVIGTADREDDLCLLAIQTS